MIDPVCTAMSQDLTHEIRTVWSDACPTSENDPEHRVRCASVGVVVQHGVDGAVVDWGAGACAGLWGVLCLGVVKVEVSVTKQAWPRMRIAPLEPGSFGPS